MKLEVLENKIIDKMIELVKEKGIVLGDNKKKQRLKILDNNDLTVLNKVANDNCDILGFRFKPISYYKSLDILDDPKDEYHCIISLYKYAAKVIIGHYIEDITLEFFDKYRSFMIRYLAEIITMTDVITNDYILDNKEHFKKYTATLEEFYEPSIEVIRELNLIDVPLAVMYNCGDSNRVIKIHLSDPDIIHIGCFKGIRDEAVEAISEKYSGEKKEDYIRKVDNCFRKASYKISSSYLDEDDGYQERLSVDFLNKLERIEYHDHYKTIIEEDGYDFLDRRVNEFIGNIVIDRLFEGPDKYRNFDYKSLENEQKMKLMIEACNVISHDIDQILFAKSAFVLHGHTVKESDIVESLGLDLLMELDINYKDLKEMLELVYLGYDENLYSGLENITYAISNLKGKRGFAPGEIIMAHDVLGTPVNQNGYQYDMKNQEYLLEMRGKLKDQMDIEELAEDISIEEPNIPTRGEIEEFVKQWGVDLENDKY